MGGELAVAIMGVVDDGLWGIVLCNIFFRFTCGAIGESVCTRRCHLQLNPIHLAFVILPRSGSALHQLHHLIHF